MQENAEDEGGADHGAARDIFTDVRDRRRPLLQGGGQRCVRVWVLPSQRAGSSGLVTGADDLRRGPGFQQGGNGPQEEGLRSLLDVRSQSHILDAPPLKLLRRRASTSFAPETIAAEAASITPLAWYSGRQL